MSDPRAVADGWAEPMSDLEFAALMEDRHVKGCFEHGACPDCATAFRQARNAVAAVLRLLDDAGRLLPAGSELVATQYLIDWTWADGDVKEWGSDHLEGIRQRIERWVVRKADGLPAESYAVYRRRHWRGPREPVAAEEINGG